MQQPVTDTVSQRWVTDIGMPVADGALAGNYSGSYLVTVLYYLQEITSFPVCQGREQEVVDNQELHPTQLGQGLEVRAISMGLLQGLKQAGSTCVKNCEASTGSRIAQGTGNI